MAAYFVARAANTRFGRILNPVIVRPFRDTSRSQIFLQNQFAALSRFPIPRAESGIRRFAVRYRRCWRAVFYTEEDCRIHLSRTVRKCVLKFLLLGSAMLAAPATPDDSIELGFRQMYNLDFPGAHRTFGDWKLKHPADPLGYVSDAAAHLFGEFDRMKVLQSEFFVHDETFSKSDPLKPDPMAKAAFLKELETGERLAKEAMAKSSGKDLNAMFAWVLTFGLRAESHDSLTRANTPSFSSSTAKTPAPQVA